jgi:DNA-binding HxlR family transcriptional regulator
MDYTFPAQRPPINRRARSADPALGLSAPARRRTVTPMSTTTEANELEMIRGTSAVVELLAGKWNVPVLYLLASGTRRYSEVLYEVGEISKKTLTQTLRGLERDGLVSRRVLAEVPARVEYSLTPLGWSITGPLMAMYEWSEQHLALAA